MRFRDFESCSSEIEPDDTFLPILLLFTNERATAWRRENSTSQNLINQNKRQNSKTKIFLRPSSILFSGSAVSNEKMSLKDNLEEYRSANEINSKELASVFKKYDSEQVNQVFLWSSPIKSGTGAPEFFFLFPLKIISWNQIRNNNLFANFNKMKYFPSNWRRSHQLVQSKFYVKISLR